MSGGLCAGSVLTRRQECLHVMQPCTESSPKNSLASPFTTEIVLACLHATSEYTRRVAMNQTYYLFCGNGHDSTFEGLLMVASDVGAVLTQRLLLHASSLGGEAARVYGAVNDPCWYSAELPPQVIRLSQLVEPSRFTDDKVGKYWSLLSCTCCKVLLKHFKEDPRYSEPATDKKPNYYKNTVCNFEYEMERRWSNGSIK